MILAVLLNSYWGLEGIRILRAAIVLPLTNIKVLRQTKIDFLYGSLVLLWTLIVELGLRQLLKLLVCCACVNTIQDQRTSH